MAQNDTISRVKGKALMRSALTLMPSRSSRSRASCTAGIVGAEVDEAGLAALVSDGDLGLRHQRSGGIELAADAVEHAGVDAAVLGVAGVLVVGGAAGEEGALGWMRAGKRAVGHGIAVDVLVAAPVLALELLELVELLRVQHLAAIVDVLVVPGEGVDHPLVHADVEVGHDDDGRLQPLGEVEGLRAHREALGGVLGNSSTCLVSPCEA